MNKQKQKILAEKKIKLLLQKAKKYAREDSALSKEYVRKARRSAMHFNIKLSREMRKKFCRKCLSYFTSDNSSIRLKRGFLVLKCLNCGALARYKAY